jgi:hypothetical protein
MKHDETQACETLTIRIPILRQVLADARDSDNAYKTLGVVVRREARDLINSHLAQATGRA